MSKAEETEIDIDSLTEQLNELGKLKEQVEALEEEKENHIAQFYTPEIRAQVEEIKVKFRERAESIRKEIVGLDADVRARVVQYGETVKGDNWRAVWIKGRGTWDTESLNKYAESHPEILIYRTDWDLDAIEEHAQSNPEILVCYEEGQPRVSISKIHRKSGDKREKDLISDNVENEEQTTDD